MSVTPSASAVSYVIKPVLFIICLVPLVWLVWGAINDTLGANPVEVMTRETGEWVLRFLLITLSITPARKILNLPWLIKLRRMLGLFVFFYAVMHFITYIWFDQYFNWSEIVKDVVKRPFITIGFAAFVLLIPLALTSNKIMIRRLKKNWLVLHKLIYVIAVLGVLHFTWLVKADYLQPVVYFLILLLLLVYRTYIQRNTRSIN
ncbi:MAG: sulfoxide reductase heme-binding subunit YedZ [Gammaproteobacteria bacterium]|nr:sulfoxide reductase heme-binding subunit YedZ [Gammaproteobacteria bacterium]